MTKYSNTRKSALLLALAPFLQPACGGETSHSLRAGGFDPEKSARLTFGRAHGYETNARGFSMSGKNLLASFRRTQLKGMVFMTGKSMVEKDEGANFGGEMAALANGWKRLFAGEKGPHFVYTIPSKELAPKITKPEGIKGASATYAIDAWPMNKAKGVDTSSNEINAEALIEALIKAVY